MNTEAYGCSHVGQRAKNEDAFCYDTDLGLYVVADGIGGYPGGDIASHLVVETILDFFNRHDRQDDRDVESLLGMAIRLASREVNHRQIGHLAYMGSTVAVMLRRHQRVWIAHVGDSRVYRLRQGKLEQLTQDHSTVAEQRVVGYPSPHAHNGVAPNRLTRAMGIPSLSKPDIISLELEGNDCFLLCSDGLSNVLYPAEIERRLRLRPTQKAAETLVHHAVSAGGYDNITSVVVNFS